MAYLETESAAVQKSRIALSSRGLFHCTTESGLLALNARDLDSTLEPDVADIDVDSCKSEGGKQLPISSLSVTLPVPVTQMRR
jgi:hypothetical protein